MAIRQHKSMAMGKPIDAGIVAALPVGIAHPDRDMAHAPLTDGKRGTPPAIGGGAGKMAMTADSDHGPHRARKVG